MEATTSSVRISKKNKLENIFNQKFLGVIVIVIMCIAWFIVAKMINKQLVLPDFAKTAEAFFKGWTDKRTMNNMMITIKRVSLGVFYAIVVGTVLGLVMGYSNRARAAFSPIVNSIRQIPIMAWVPISIIWFGLGEGPTVFLIFMAAVFPLIINVIAGVINIDQNYINAAKSMGAKTIDVYRDVIIPGALPSFMTGCRLAVGSGWQSVICAEFIATSSGFGFIMIEAQERLETSKLYALMIMSALIGFVIDQLLRVLDRRLTCWRYKDGMP